MKCQQCSEREATTSYVHIAEDAKETLYLCADCMAVVEGASAPAADEEVKTVADQPATEAAEGGERLADCSECGMSYAEFRKEARFGCGECYTAFASRLDRLFNRIHGADSHVGKGTATKVEPPKDDLVRLKERLQVAVAAEDYEEAAELRDQIRCLESEG
jgi:protein arginine kinase activator